MFQDAILAPAPTLLLMLILMGLNSGQPRFLFQILIFNFVSGLRDLRAVHVPATGRWFLLDQDYHMRVWSHISNFIAENSWCVGKYIFN